MGEGECGEMSEEQVIRVSIVTIREIKESLEAQLKIINKLIKRWENNKHINMCMKEIEGDCYELVYKDYLCKKHYQQKYEENK